MKVLNSPVCLSPTQFHLIPPDIRVVLFHKPTNQMSNVSIKRNNPKTKTLTFAFLKPKTLSYDLLTEEYIFWVLPPWIHKNRETAQSEIEERWFRTLKNNQTQINFFQQLEINLGPLRFPLRTLTPNKKYLVFEYDHSDFCGTPDGWAVYITQCLRKRRLKTWACAFWECKSSDQRHPDEIVCDGYINPNDKKEIAKFDKLPPKIKKFMLEFQIPNQELTNFHRDCGMGGDWNGFYFELPS